MNMEMKTCRIVGVSLRAQLLLTQKAKPSKAKLNRSKPKYYAGDLSHMVATVCELKLTLSQA
jgi:hypothetical protein